MTATSRIPGWTFTDLGSLGRWGSGGTPNRSTSAYYEGGDIPWLVIGDLNERVVIRAQNAITKRGLENSSAKLLPPGTLLVAMYGSIGKTSVTGVACATNQAIAYCIPHPGVNLRYLHRAVQWVKPALIAQGQGGAQQNISQGILKAQTIPLAPESEQKRIADKLDTVLTRVDAVNTRLARVAPILKRFRQSVLAAATSGRLTEDWRRSNADGAVHSQWRQRNNKSIPPLDSKSLSVPATWCVLRAQDVVEADANIVYGIVQPGPKLVSGVAYVQTTDIIAGQIQVGSLCRTSVEIADKYQRSSIRGGDVLLGIIRATKVAVVPDELSGGNISRSVARLRPCSDVVPKFLAIALESPAVQSWLRAEHRGMDMPVLNLAQVRLAPLPIAPIDEQREIVRRVEALFAFADRLDARLQTAQTATERLTPALLAKAFRGELVSQDPNDEPALALLERIRAAEKNPPASKGKGPRGRPRQRVN